jgi:HNH endonuclease
LMGDGKGRPGVKRTLKPTKGYVNNNGYKVIRNGEGKWILEHRYVMEQTLGRTLCPDERVHHKDGNRVNNASQNLELWLHSQPSGQRVEDLVVWAKEIISRYQ